ncbi:MAG: hypothetical protein HRU34_00230 [Richelia sp.]|nr:hypothetical protein [Richelia sp.]CDN10880.1 Mobile element protein [Richelia intracellularis]
MFFEIWNIGFIPANYTEKTKIYGVAELGDDFTKFSTIYQWFQTLIHPLIQQRHIY